MKKAILRTSALLILLILGLLYLHYFSPFQVVPRPIHEPIVALPQDYPLNLAESTEQTSAVTPAVETAATTATDTTFALVDPSTRLTGQALINRANETMARLARSYTPDLQREYIETRMKMRDPMYQRLFDTWQLDPSLEDEVLEVIRERETELMTIGHKLNLTGMDGLHTWAAERKATRNWAITQLSLLLNQQQLQQFIQEETSFDTAASAKGAQIATDIAKRQQSQGQSQSQTKQTGHP